MASGSTRCLNQNLPKYSPWFLKRVVTQCDFVFRIDAWIYRHVDGHEE